MGAGLDLKDLRFGELNNIKENDANTSGDRRRTNTVTTLRFATEKAYEVNTLQGRDTFNGIIINARMVTVPLVEDSTKLAQLKSKVAYEIEDSSPAAAAAFLYKVYIPELSALPPPTSATDPVIQNYSDVMLAPGVVAAGSSPDLPYGTQVVVTYADMGNMTGAKITAITSRGNPMVQSDPCGRNLQSNYANGIPKSLGSLTNDSSPIIETNPGVDRVKKTSSNVNWGGNPKLQEMLEALNLAAEEEGVWLGSTSAARGGYDTARILRDNYIRNGGANGGREYLTGLYSNSGPKYATILEMTHLTADEQIRKAVMEIPYLSNNNHSNGRSLDIRFGFSETDAVPKANSLPPTRVTKVITHALKIYPIDLLLEDDHFHLTALGFGEDSIVRFANGAPRTSSLGKKVIKDGLLTYGVTNTETLPTSE